MSRNLCGFLVMLLIPLCMRSQQLPKHRSTIWSADSHFELPERSINVHEHGIIPGADCAQLLNKLIEETKDSGATLYFPPGVYFFDATIKIPGNIVLKGAGSDSTKFEYDISGNFIEIVGSEDKKPIEVKSHFAKDDTFIELENTAGLSPGDYLRLCEDDDGRISSSWAFGEVAQIIRIDSIEGNIVYFKTPLRMDFKKSNHPRVFKINMASGSGVQCLSIQCNDSTENQTISVWLDYAAYCSIQGVHSTRTNFAHVAISHSYNVHVSNSFFTQSYRYGQGGQGYGVVLQFASGNCLVQNNIFRKLRHSMLLQACANGNIIAYNYSLEPFSSEPGIPPEASGDLVLHGNWVFMNLFESNEVQNIVIDYSHGNSGPYNTYFRNRVNLYGIIMTRPDASPSQNFIGNLIVNPTIFFGLYQLQGGDHFEYGNIVKGKTTPAGTTQKIDNSLYLNSTYEFQTHLLNFSSNSQGHYIPARRNYALGKLAFCTLESADTSTARLKSQAEKILTVYPNPAHDFIRISGARPGSIAKIYSAQSSLIGIYKTDALIDITYLAPGIYFIDAEGTFIRFVKD